MRARWEGLHAALVRSISTLQADRWFRERGRADGSLSGFDSLVGLVEYLTSRSGDLDHKDKIYAALVRAAQARDAGAVIAQTVAWLGLWPGLDAVYRRRVRHFHGQEDELVSALSAAFTRLLGELNLARVKRIAATLVLSTERDLMDERRRGWDEAERVCHGREEEDRATSASPAPESGLSFEGELLLLRGRLLPIAGADVDLLLAVTVLDESQRDAAELLGLTHEAARKRFQRVVERIRAHLEKTTSQSASAVRVSGEAKATRPEGAD